MLIHFLQRKEKKWLQVNQYSSENKFQGAQCFARKKNMQQLGSILILPERNFKKVAPTMFRGLTVKLSILTYIVIILSKRI